MRAPGFPIVLLCAACQLRTVPAAQDAPPGVDAPDVDAPGVDAPIDAPPVDMFRKQITIQRMRVTGAHAEFPVWIAIANDSDLRSRSTQGGTDLHFTRPDGTPLAHQVQRWDKPGGRLEAWVRVDVSDAADTVIELRYGDPGRAVAPSPPMVFSSSFAAVWHLDDSLSTTAVADAKGQVPGTAAGGLGTSHQVPARLGGGIDFDGVAARIEFTNPFTGGTNHTISAWVKQENATDFDSIVTVGNPAMNQSRWFHSHYTATVSAGFFGNDWPNNPSPLPDIENEDWVLLHWTYDSGGRIGRIYRDGALVASHTFSGMGGGPNTQGPTGFLGYALQQWGPNGDTPCALNGILDEVRLATAVRSAGWIATEFANQDSPQTFYTVGPEAKLPQAAN